MGKAEPQRDDLAARRRVRRPPINVANLRLEGVRLRDADMLVVHEADMLDESDLDVLGQLHEITGLFVLGLASGMSLETLDETAMREAGWVRAPAPEQGGE